ncbi:MAG: T9SS type A sorting domain-containing protein [Bacteroidota bacterium]
MASNFQTGYTRVIGYGPPSDPTFNPNNIRDISWNKDYDSLETYCYTVYNRNTGAWIGWFPTVPDNVVYRYSVWGIHPTSSVDESGGSGGVAAPLEVLCSAQRMAGQMQAVVRFTMTMPGPVNVAIYNVMGTLITEREREFWEYGAEQSMWVNLEGVPSGAYIVVVRAKNGGGVGSKTFMFVK